MFTSNLRISLITAVLPSSSANEVIDHLTYKQDTATLISKARGTLLHEHWWKSWVPPISPSKTMLRMVLPENNVDQIVNTVIKKGRLDKQASGAVFSTPCESAYVGSDFHILGAEKITQPTSTSHKASENLSAIFCSVGHRLSDRIAKAAINAGAHGPVVYYAEGRGLRDRLGWLRITKDSEQEILMIIADEADVEEIFDAMAKEGEFHLPGRGFMYRLPIDMGIFNLPSRVSHHHYAANTQQIINAIDHLTGHTHWRDQSVFDVGNNGKGVGLKIHHENHSELTNQVCFTTIVNRDQSHELMDLMLDAGAPGLNVIYARFIAANDYELELAQAHVNHEYATIRCITDHDTAKSVAKAIETDAEKRELRDMCVMAHSVPRVAKYVYHQTEEHRSKPKRFALT